MQLCKLAMGLVLLLSLRLAAAANPLFGEIELDVASKVEKNAGVWLDGQYLGHVRELRGNGDLVLPPGEHRVLVKLIGFEDLERNVIVEPGQSQKIHVALVPDASVQYAAESELAELKLAVEPEEAAVFVNDTYAGYVDQFNGRRGMRMGPGVYSVRIALPGYDSFETDITITASQEYEIKTKLRKASIVDQSPGLAVSQAQD
jgi:PEGA domain